MTRRAAALLACAFLVSCADPRDGAQRLAERAGFAARDIPTRPFRLMAYVRPAAGAPVLHLYIEGDGHSWRTGDQPSDDPTPRSPVALELAARDPAESVAWLARPCQYVVADPACDEAFWTGQRYGETVVGSVNQAIDALMAATGARRLDLTGFSGGGALAALIAERRSDVDSLRTVAANLDTADWTARHGVTPLRGSLNPADAAPSLAALPQVHFVGAEDTNVPEATVRSFVHRIGRPACVTVAVVPGLGHNGDWAARWPDLLRQRPGCAE